MMKFVTYSELLILTSCISLSLSTQEHTRPSAEDCKFEEQERQLTCRDLTLLEAPKSPHAELVKMLDLSRNNIRLLNPSFFNGYNSVVTLIMRNAKIQQIDPGAFHLLNDLQTVDLSYNIFTFVEPELFTENPKLEKVSLSNNPLTMQSPYLPIVTSPSLSHLKLHNCKLSELSSHSLSKLPNMRSLDLSQNTFKELRIDVVFSHLHLVDIDLTKNLWICNDDFEKLVCWAYRVSHTRRNISCRMKTLVEKSYNLKDQHELCDKPSVTISSVTSITSTPKEAVDVTTDMTIRKPVTVFQNPSPEYTTTVLQEDTRKRSSESHDAFTTSMTTQPPRPYVNEGPENSETGSWHSLSWRWWIVIFVFVPLILIAVLCLASRFCQRHQYNQLPVQNDQETADVTVQHPGQMNRGSDSDLP